MKAPITYKKLDNGLWGAWIPAHFGKVVVGETIYVTKRSGEKNPHAVASIVTVYKSGVVVSLKDIDESTPSEIAAVEGAIKQSATKSNVFKQAHKLTKAIIKAGDSYSATFAACLKLVIGIAKKVKTAVKSRINRAAAYDAIMNEGYSERGNFNPYRYNSNL